MNRQKGERYVCPECKRDFAWNWINRHLVTKHSYRYWDNQDVYNPAATGERIVSAAIRRDEKIYTGHRHAYIIRQLVAHDGRPVTTSSKQGFLTDTGRFVDRTEAFIIAKAAGQIPPETAGELLFSEDIWPGQVN